MELYYPSLDMMEISRLLDRYAALGKPIYVTELGVSSRTGVDARSNYFNREDFSRTLGSWHRQWDENMQADWIENFYVIAYSKPAIRAITYTHAPDMFWPFGGLFNRDMTPKLSFTRLQDLLRSWGFQGAKRP